VRRFAGFLRRFFSFFFFFLHLAPRLGMFYNAKRLESGTLQEFRIPLPFSVEEYRIGHDFTVVRSTLDEIDSDPSGMNVELIASERCSHPILGLRGSVFVCFFFFGGLFFFSFLTLLCHRDGTEDQAPVLFWQPTTVYCTNNAGRTEISFNRRRCGFFRLFHDLIFAGPKVAVIHQLYVQ
jgi:hypothetical protein